MVTWPRTDIESSNATGVVRVVVVLQPAAASFRAGLSDPNRVRTTNDRIGYAHTCGMNSDAHSQGATSNSGVRRAYAEVSPSICSAKVRRLHFPFGHKNRRTRRTRKLARLPTEASARVRLYRLWTRRERVPQTGHEAPWDTVQARIRIPAADVSADSIVTPARCGSRTRRSQQLAEHSKIISYGSIASQSDPWIVESSRKVGQNQNSGSVDNRGVPGLRLRPGRALINCELYLPKTWTADRERCRGADIDDGVNFEKKPVVAHSMIGRVLDVEVPFG
uniref:Uncharacterized protein n=1 Tax=Rhodococcus sp. NS1 TaxID=402236 RepID=A0A097SPW1_9NOCA|nr:hypothetical protein LRS1606.133 [Rhodococcus sp. NS1]